MLPGRLTTAPDAPRAGATGSRRAWARGLTSMLAATVALAGATGCSDDEPRAGGADRTITAPGTAARGETARKPSPPISGATAVRLRGTGDRVLGPIRVGRGGTTLRWTNRGSGRVFSLLTQSAIVVDADFRTSGERRLPPGRYVLEVVASGRWTITVPNASPAR